MGNYKRVPTSCEVFTAIHAQHPEMRLFESYSAPEGDQLGDRRKSRIFTSYGFESGDFPVLATQTTWDIDPETRERTSHRTECWLCLPVREDRPMTEHEAETVKSPNSGGQPMTEAVVMPVCPYCKCKMNVARYQGYYDSFDYWQCDCNELPNANAMNGLDNMPRHNNRVSND